MQMTKGGWAACGGVLLAPMLACVAATHMPGLSGGVPLANAHVSAQGGGVQGAKVVGQKVVKTQPKLRVWTYVRANYAVRAQLTDLRQLKLGADFMVALDVLSELEQAAQSHFVEAVPITSAELAINGQSLNLPFYMSGGRLIAFLPTGRVPSGATVGPEAMARRSSPITSDRINAVTRAGAAARQRPPPLSCDRF